MQSTELGIKGVKTRSPREPKVIVPVPGAATGWLQGEEEWGRPVDVLVMPDGALLVSDDRAGAIYRISYRR